MEGHKKHENDDFQFFASHVGMDNDDHIVTEMGILNVKPGSSSSSATCTLCVVDTRIAVPNSRVKEPNHSSASAPTTPLMGRCGLTWTPAPCIIGALAKSNALNIIDGGFP
jgi:hypothetical protein